MSQSISVGAATAENSLGRKQHCRIGVEGKPTFTLSYDQPSNSPGDMKSLLPLVQDVPSLQHSKAALTTRADDYEVQVMRTLGIDVVHLHPALMGNQRRLAYYKGTPELSLPDIEVDGIDNIPDMPALWWAQVTSHSNLGCC
ncbi:hypothetical protein ABBQ38_012068 [Trebouxia sp. C0009 RCD-2024]